MMAFVLLDDQKTGVTRYFTRPEKIITAFKIEDLTQAFADIEAAQKSGYYLAGYFAYELGYALEPVLNHRLPETGQPLLQLGVFKAPPKPAPAHMLYTARPASLSLKPRWRPEDYLNRYEAIKDYIEAGDVYQINLTFPMIGQTSHSLAKLYASFRQSQPGRYGGIIHLGGTDIISFSPELFFEKKGREMRMRPMKGTRPRRVNPDDDEALRTELLNEPKSKAENLMIVDLLRNDLSRLCEAGSVKVPDLFHVETYPTVHQMISEVTGTLRDDVNWADIFKGLFPCGSVTGAPKIRAMEIIDTLESGPRGAYCGAMGYIAPDGDACFNVAIRSLQIQDGTLRYDVGSGIVLDSEGEDEYEECRLKSDIFKPKPQGFFETLRWDTQSGFIRSEQHMARLIKAASAHRITLDAAHVHHLLSDAVHGKTSPQRIRLSLDRKGGLRCQSHNLFPLAHTPARLCLSPYPLRPARQITAHKSESRDFYDGERRRLQALHDVDDVLFTHADGSLAEGSFTSLFIEEKGTLYTPPLNNILPGIFRQSLIKSGRAKEATISVARLKKAEAVFIGNSLRGLLPATLIHVDEA